MHLIAAGIEHPWWVDAFAFLVLALQLPVPLFWLLIHPFIGFWRRRSRRAYIGAAAVSWLGMWLVLFLPVGWWLAKRFTEQLGVWSFVTVLAGGLGLVACDKWLLSQVKRDMNWRVLVGLAELQPERPESRLVQGGIYDRVRHPRYLGALFSCWGAVLLTGATRLAMLVAGFTFLALMVIELEERELLRRLGEDYAEYRRRVPRLLLRWRSAPATPAGDRVETTEEARG